MSSGDFLNGGMTEARASGRNHNENQALRMLMDLHKQYEDLELWRRDLEKWRREEIIDRYLHREKYPENAAKTFFEMEYKLLEEERKVLVVQMEDVRAAERERLGTEESNRDYLRHDPPPVYINPPPYAPITRRVRPPAAPYVPITRVVRPPGRPYAPITRVVRPPTTGPNPPTTNVYSPQRRLSSPQSESTGRGETGQVAHQDAETGRIRNTGLHSVHLGAGGGATTSQSPPIGTMIPSARRHRDSSEESEIEILGTRSFLGPQSSGNP